MAERTFAVDDGKPIPPVGTRKEGKHQSAVLQKARNSIDAGVYASEHEAAEAFYEEYSGRRVADEKTEADVLRRKEATKKMRAKLRGIAPNELKEGA